MKMKKLDPEGEAHPLDLPVLYYNRFINFHMHSITLIISFDSFNMILIVHLQYQMNSSVAVGLKGT